MLLEPASVLAKAWEHIERIGRRAVWEPRRVLVTGAGPIGLLAALMGVQRGLEVHVLDRRDRRPQAGPGPRPRGDLPHRRGRQGRAPAADVVIECTGVGQLVFDVMRSNRRPAASSA